MNDNTGFKIGKGGRYGSVDFDRFKIDVSGMDTDYPKINRRVGNTDVDFILINHQLCITQKDMGMLYGISDRTTLQQLSNIYGGFIEDQTLITPKINIYALATSFISKNQYSDSREVGGCVTNTPTLQSKMVVRVTYYYPHDILMLMAMRSRNIEANLIRQELLDLSANFRQHGFMVDEGFLLHPQNNTQLTNFTNQVNNMLPERLMELRSWVPTINNLMDKIHSFHPMTEVERSKAIAYMQNIAHAATSGSSSAGIVRMRCSAEAANCGLNSFRGETVKYNDLKIGKNYLSVEELKFLYSLGVHLIAALDLYYSKHGVLCWQDSCRLFHKLSYRIDGYIKNYGTDILDWPLTHTFDIRRPDANRHARLEWVRFNEICEQMADQDLALLTHISETYIEII